MRRVVLCDFDGTIIKGNLENTFVRFLLTRSRFKWPILLVSLFTLPVNLLLNKTNHPSVFKSWTFVLGRHKQKLIDQFLASGFCRNAPGLSLRDDVVLMLGNLQFDHLTILTGSDEDLVRAFLTGHPQIAYNELIGSQVGTCNFIVKRHPLGKAKCRFVDPDDYNIGIANEHSDRFYLARCNEHYYV